MLSNLQRDLLAAAGQHHAAAVAGEVSGDCSQTVRAVADLLEDVLCGGVGA